MSSSVPLPRTVIAPSLLSCDFAQLGAESERMLTAGADWLHVDVMDGHFVSNLTLGPPVVKALHRALRDSTSTPRITHLDVHMMVDAPEHWADELGKIAQAGADGAASSRTAPSLGCTFHYEVFGGDNVERAAALARRIKAAGMRAGIAIRPATPVSALDALLFHHFDAFDMVLVMTVEPGHGGQKFMRECMPKVAALRERYPTLDIEVDGGIGPSADTAGEAAAAGANVLVSGSAVFSAREADGGPAGAIAKMRRMVDERRAGGGGGGGADGSTTASTSTTTASA